MGLVDYSDSESDSEVVQKAVAPPSTTATGKKAFQKLVDRGSGKIVVNLATVATNEDGGNTNDEPPAKRAKTAGSGNSRFSNFGSFLPPPKKAAAVIGKSVSASASTSRTGGSAPGPGVHLKTGAEPAFSRNSVTSDEADGNGTGSASKFGSGLSLPPPKKSASGPTIPDGQKPAEEVKLVGKPLMFKPLSVSRKPQKKKKDLPPGFSASTTPVASKPPPTTAAEPPAAQPPKKKVSLFSMGGDDDKAAETSPSNGTYQPLFNGAAVNTPETERLEYDAYTQQHPVNPTTQNFQPPQQQQNTLSSIADSLSLSKADRRELFGRNGPPPEFSSANGGKIINFNMEREYEHNEQLRQSGALADQVHNPVRSIAPGKHSLRQMVNMAQNNQAALEDSFAAGRSNRSAAAGKYGWK
ncbi:mitotic checkpoint regulator, MAD2B-interacting-domain-containing protein [Rhypophila decipiens]|uniref:Mitotic checkpoint regulator, MAD2B-interacting-domain-containing protein n=1 Tax=Rhypophila decipiens TaxID=261697 RepID=A0AAN7B4Y4_9PEZI|nr:mitotic checkpoint regulator, MAD2B-interacting-domain-containing protein [Rhypophila decipiens]